MSDPLVSVVVTLYNYDKYIEECADSIWNQTYPNVEMVIVDDGSTDGGKCFTSFYSDCMYRHEKNLGYAAVLHP